MAQQVNGAAIVVGGAVAKGAFAAGALAYVTEKLQQENRPIRSLVGTSSGALNATKIACGVRAGEPARAANELVELWLSTARARKFAEIDPWSALVWHGISGSDKVMEILEKACPIPESPEHLRSVALRIVVATLRGGPQAHTSFEQVERFQDADFENGELRERMFQAAAASAAVPYAFKPVSLSDVGACVDGGLVNNTPIKEAIAHDPNIDRVIVIVAEPADMRLSEKRAESLANVSLAVRLLDMTVNERLARDLQEAKDVNDWLETLDGLVADGQMTSAVRKKVIESLYHRDARDFRHIDLIEIRPAAELPGNPFKGFFCDRLRSEYVNRGREAADKAWSERKDLDAGMQPTA